MSGTVTRRGFNRNSLVSLLSALAATSQVGAAAAQPGQTAASGRRDVIKQALPGSRRAILRSSR